MIIYRLDFDTHLLKYNTAILLVQFVHMHFCGNMNNEKHVSLLLK